MNMKRNLISFNSLKLNINYLWEKQWMLLTCGDFKVKHFNVMTVAWGSIGNIWYKPFVQVVVRPTRYTYEFMEQYNSFTLSAFPENQRNRLNFLGSRSGRDTNKIERSGLTPVASTRIEAPAFAEAELVFECQKIYWDDLNPDNFIAQNIKKHYPLKDYHRIYFGEILVIYGINAYQR
jgi:flavin reductase (DIM6/NTAB) family NADH-FMN oxidoreductase RutF